MGRVSPAKACGPGVLSEVNPPAGTGGFQDRVEEVMHLCPVIQRRYEARSLVQIPYKRGI